MTERGLHQRLVRLEAARTGRGAVHVPLHSGLAGEALQQWQANAVKGLPPAALVVVVPQRGFCAVHAGARGGAE